MKFFANWVAGALTASAWWAAALWGHARFGAGMPALWILAVLMTVPAFVGFLQLVSVEE